ncbi:MAG: hypothetical protein QG670_345 [Thermoproteota archaeon]|nr:hypothetical protein [Thermoproteota archaeon]
MKTKDIALASVISALYTVGVIFLAPISFQLVQVRVADALIPLSIVFGWPVVLGVTLGAVVANIYGGFGLIDIVGGSIANLIAAYAGWKISSRRFKGSSFVATVVQNLIVSSIVGSYLAVIFDVHLEIGMLNLLLGSIVSMNILGYALVLLFRKSSIATKA